MFPDPFGVNSNKKSERDSKRSFGATLEKNTYDNQKGKCYKCKKPVKVSHMQYHHLVHWAKGGKSISKNCVGLCMECHKDVHDEERIKENDKKRKTSKNDSPFGGSLFKEPKMKKSKNPFAVKFKF